MSKCRAPAQETSRPRGAVHHMTPRDVQHLSSGRGAILWFIYTHQYLTGTTGKFTPITTQWAWTHLYSGFRVAGTEGLEPPIFRLTAGGFTIKLHPQLLYCFPNRIRTCTLFLVNTG